MILRNKRTLEKLEISYFDFKKNFTKEIQIAFESYKQTQLNKFFSQIKNNNYVEQFN